MSANGLPSFSFPPDVLVLGRVAERRVDVAAGLQQRHVVRGRLRVRDRAHARLELLHLGAGLGAGHERHLVEVRNPVLVPVVLVGDEDLLVRGERRDLPRTTRERDRGLHVGRRVGRRELRLLQDHAREAAEHVGPVGVGLLEVEDHRLGIGLLDAVDLVVAGRAQRAGRLEVRVPAEVDVGGRDRRAVVPVRVRVEVVRHREVRRGLETLVLEAGVLGDERRRDEVALGIELRQAGQHVDRHQPLQPRRVRALRDRVDAVGPLFGNEDELAALLLRPRGAGAGLGGGVGRALRIVACPIRRRPAPVPAPSAARRGAAGACACNSRDLPVPRFSGWTRLANESARVDDTSPQLESVGTPAR